MKTFFRNNYDKIIYILISFVISIILSLIFFYTTPGVALINYAATGLIGSFFVGIFYEIIKFQKGHKVYSEVELKYGPILLNNRSEDFMTHYSNQIEKLILNNDINIFKIYI